MAPSHNVMRCIFYQSFHVLKEMISVLSVAIHWFNWVSFSAARINLAFIYMEDASYVVCIYASN